MGGRAGGGGGSGMGGGKYAKWNRFDTPKGVKKSYNATYMGGKIKYTVTWQGTGSDGKAQMEIHMSKNKKEMNKFIKQNLIGNGYTGNGTF